MTEQRKDTLGLGRALQTFLNNYLYFISMSVYCGTVELNLNRNLHVNDYYSTNCCSLNVQNF